MITSASPDPSPDETPKPVPVDKPKVAAEEIKPTTVVHSSILAVPSKPTPETIVKHLLDVGVKLFRDELGKAYASLPCDPDNQHFENWPLSLKVRMFRQRLQSLIKDITSIHLSRSVLGEVVDRLHTLADAGPEIPLANRFGIEGDEVRIDIGDDLWQAIRVTSQKWEIFQPQEPLFRRHPHQRPLPIPTDGGKVHEIFEFVPIDDQGERLLLLAWIISAMHANVSTPVWILLGTAGALKSTRMRVVRSLLDPSRTIALGDWERRDLVQVMVKHALPCFDNLGLFKRGEADFFCRAVTGAAFERRQLFTDDDSVLMSFRRAIILNGLELPSDRVDFLDRCLIFHTTRPTDFKLDTEVERAFTQAWPRLYGGLLDLLVKTLELLPTTAAPTEFRLADFGRLGRAVARALGKSTEEFDVAYRRSRNGEFEEITEDDPLLQATVSLARTFEGELTTTVLLEKLNAEARRRNIDTKDKRWPRTTSQLSARLTELVPVLRLRSVDVVRLPRRNTGVYWKVVRNPAVPTNDNPPTASND